MQVVVADGGDRATESAQQRYAGAAALRIT